jgi:hypothetical protein
MSCLKIFPESHDQNKEEEMGGACGTYGGVEKYIHGLRRKICFRWGDNIEMDLKK